MVTQRKFQLIEAVGLCIAVACLGMAARAYGENSMVLRFGYSGGSQSYPITIGPTNVDRIMGPFLATQNARLEASLQQARAAILRQDEAQNINRMVSQLGQIASVNKVELGLHQEWLKRYQEQINSGPAPVPLEKQFPNLAQGVQRQDPVAMIHGLDDYGKAILAQPGDLSPGARLENRAKGVFVDEQGLILGLPDAPSPVALASPWPSASGVRVRNSLNRLMVAKQVIDSEFGSYCAKHGPEACQARQGEITQFHSRYTDLALLHAVADRLGIRNHPLFQGVMSSLEETSDYLLGVSQGLIGTAFDLAEGAEKLILHPVDTLSLLGVQGCEAIVHFDKTFQALSSALEKKWDQFLTGTPQERGYLVGRMSGEVLTLIAPSLAAAKVTEGLGVSAELARLTQEGTTLAEKIGVLAGKGTLEVWGTATEKALDRVAMIKKIASLEGSGALAPAAAKDLRAFSSVFPRSANEVLSTPNLIRSVEGTEGLLLRSKPAELLQTLKSDAALQQLVRKDGTAALNFVEQYGFGAGGGLAKLEAVKPGIFVKLRETGATRQLADYASSSGTLYPRSAEGLKRLELYVPDVMTSGIREEAYAAAFLGNRAAGASEHFLKELAAYGAREHLNIGRLAIMSEFEQGATKFVSHKAYKTWIEGATELRGAGKAEEVFFISRDSADRLLKRVGSQAPELEKALGLAPGYFAEGGGVIRLDLPFRFGDRPKLPSGFEAGANEYFRFGMGTPSGVPELILHSPSTKGMRKTELVNMK